MSSAAHTLARRKCREVKVGPYIIGGDHPIRVQSMTSTDTADIESTVAQINALAEAGCEIIRVTVDTAKAAKAIPVIRKRIALPLVVDIHYNHQLAIEVAPYVDKIRINPGNIGDEAHVKAVVERANEFDLPIRVGVNQGSLGEAIATKYGAHIDGKMIIPPEEGYPAQALVESALNNVEILERYGFYRTIISVKSSNVAQMIQAYRLLANQCDYPLHLGVTEAGTRDSSNIKSSIGIGSLLMDGIGDTLRVSIAARATEEKTEEIRTGFKILSALGLRQFGLEVISCPTCGRQDQDFDTAHIARELERLNENRTRPLLIAVMGCYVNGPGEAAEADIGVVASSKAARLYCHGHLVQNQVPYGEVIERVSALIEKADAEADAASGAV